MSDEPSELAFLRAQVRWGRVAYLTSRLWMAAALLTVWDAIEGDRGISLLVMAAVAVVLFALWRLAVARRGPLRGWSRL